MIELRHTVALVLVCAGGLQAAVAGIPVESWMTTADQSLQLAPQAPLLFTGTDTRDTNYVEVVTGTRFQTMLGLGSSLEPTTCSNFWRLAPADREDLMRHLVDPVRGIGMNLMRLCIGTPDFTGDPWYSYCDLPGGETDPELKHFSVARERAYIIPVIQLARRTNPDLRFFASPWSPPGWMKSTGTMIGGELLPQWYPAYAQYFVRFIKAYEAEGIPIHAITVQNEPGVDRGKEKDRKWHYPSCHWTGEQERDFIREHLGPALRGAGLKTEIWCYDHNYNLKPTGDDAGLDYPRTIFRDATAGKYAAGVGFHGYVGGPEGMSVFHSEFPDVPIHFTEGSVFGVQGAVDLIQRLRNWAVSYNAWVLMLDDHGKPNNGPFAASHATVALNTRTLKADYLLNYYIYGQFMKFIPRGAVRIETRSTGQVPEQVAVQTPSGQLVLIAANPQDYERRFTLRWTQLHCQVVLPAKSVGTWRWSVKSP